MSMNEQAQLLQNIGNPRTAKGLAYERFMQSVYNQLRGMTAESKEKAKVANLDFIRGLRDPGAFREHADELATRAVTPGLVHVDSLLAQLSVMYANDEFIGERLMPGVSVSKRSDKYVKYPKRERFAYPDDLIGHRSSSNELNETREFDNYSVQDRGFKNFLDLEAVQNQDAPLDEMVDVVEAINEGIAFKREFRILAIIVASANYGGNTAAAAAKWDIASGGSIISDFLGAESGLFTGPSPTQKLGFCSLATWNTGIANNPALHELFKYTTSGLRTTTQVAQFFGLDDLLVSRARKDTANIGQSAVFTRMMVEDNVGVLRVATRPTTRSLHFGSTFRMNGDPFTTQWDDPNIGKRGGIYARVAVSEDHKVVAPDAGFLITDVLT